MSDPSPDTPNAYAPRCGHHGNPLVWLDPALRWRCPHCFPELFPAARPAAGSSSPDVTALADELRNAILDIDAHATPFGTDDDGFVSGGYLISVGSLHRALGVVGHSAAKCGGCRNCWTLDQWKAEEQLLRDELEAQATRITELERWKAEALVVLGQWDEVWEALGRPGPLGSSKAVEALTEAHRLRATDPPADGPDPCPHCTPAAGSSPPDYTVLAEQLRAVKHYESEDCWYSCPESEEGCCDDRRTGCDCHAPTMWAAADALEAQAARITELEQFLIRLGHNPDRLDLP